MQQKTCNVILKVISDIMAHWYDMYTIVIAIYFFNEKMICAYIFIISNQ